MENLKDINEQSMMNETRLNGTKLMKSNGNRVKNRFSTNDSDDNDDDQTVLLGNKDNRCSFGGQADQSTDVTVLV